MFTPPRIGSYIYIFFFQASETLIVEKQARLRAETKEEDERRERISTTAQTAAIQQQHSKEMETERLARAKLETEASLKAQVRQSVTWQGVFCLWQFCCCVGPFC